MGDEKLSTILRIAIVPQVVDMIAQKYGLDEVAATNAFYHSETYRLLSDEETKLWHFSPLTLYTVWQEEKETGKIVLPEEGL